MQNWSQNSQKLFFLSSDPLPVTASFDYLSALTRDLFSRFADYMKINTILDVHDLFKETQLE